MGSGFVQFQKKARQESDMGKVIGIDLGTTNSFVWLCWKMEVQS